MQQVAIVTGASSGIGRAIAQALIARGWHVIGAALEMPDEAVNAEWVIGDLAGDDVLAQVVERAAQRGRLDAVVNCAAINPPGALEALDKDVLRRVMAVNVEVPLRLTQRCLPLLRASHGRMIALSSVMGEVAMPLLGPYSMSKHALEALCDALRLELAGQGVGVSIVQMGAVQTPMTERMAAALDAARAALPAALVPVYERLYARMERALLAQSRTAIAPERVAKSVLTALESRMPHARYRVDAATQGLSLLRRLAPERIGDIVLRRSLGI